MSLCFSISWTSHKEDTLSGWGDLSQLIKSQALTLSSSDSLSGFSGELEGADSESFWDIEESGVISDSAYEGDDSGVELSLSFDDSGVIV
jgi:hypothetical protein